MQPFVTVIINTVNEQQERLEQTIAAFKAQQGVKLQILISTIKNDISVNVAQQMGCEVVINAEKGIYQQLNNAIQYVKGDWWCYSSGHDIALPNKLIDEINCCIKNNKQICYSDYNLINPETNEKRHVKFYDYNYQLHLTKGNFVNDCAIISTELTKKYAPFLNKLWGNDSHYDFWLRIYEGEGDVFCYNPKPTWNYIEFQDSKHVVRQKSETELQRYRVRRKQMIASHTEKPVITVGLPTYQSNIVWLAMESLCNQYTCEKWELIICEDETGANGVDYFYQYADKLKDAGCICIKYISVSRESSDRDRIALSLKWRMIALAAHKNSIGMLLQASDCYSEPNRVQTAYREFSNGADWINSRFGLFYHLKYNKSILFDVNTLDTPVGLNMGISLDIARNLKEEIYYSSVDNWLFRSMQEIKPNAKVWTDISDNWKLGIDTDGENVISKKRHENYFIARPPFVDTNIKAEDCLPEYVFNKLIRKAAVNEAQTITQCRVSRSVIFFEDKVFAKFGFKNKRIDKKKPFEIDLYKPLLLFGCYIADDFQRALNHKSDVVILWAGSDSMQHNYENMKQFIGKANIHHISGSKFISDDLQNVGLKYKYIPISLCNNSELTAVPLGNKVYIYQSRGKNDPEFYGKSIVDKLIEHYGADKFVIACADTYSKKELYAKYAECFCGLRLVKHDGLSETVAELGLMGRNVVYNGDTPNSLQYETIEDIIKQIDAESKKIGSIQNKLSAKMQQYLNVDNEFLNVNYWKAEQPLVNILIRTKQRPTYFYNCIKSILQQTYKKVNIIIGVEKGDAETLEYLKQYNYTILQYKAITERKTKPQSKDYGDWFPANYYLNLLTQKVSDGYIMYLDDDDQFLNETAIQTMVNSIVGEDVLLLWRVKYPADRIIPHDTDWNIMQQTKSIPYKSVSGIGFMFHSKYKDKIDWNYFKNGDYRVAKQLNSLTNNCNYINAVLTGVQSIPHRGQTEQQEQEINLTKININLTQNQTIMKVIVAQPKYKGREIGTVGQIVEMEESTAKAMILKKLVKEFTEELEQEHQAIEKDSQLQKEIATLNAINKKKIVTETTNEADEKTVILQDEIVDMNRTEIAEEKLIKKLQEKKAKEPVKQAAAKKPIKRK